MRSRLAQVARVLARGARWLYDLLPIPLDVRLRHRKRLAARVPGLLLASGSPEESVRRAVSAPRSNTAGRAADPPIGLSVRPCATPLVSVVVPAYNQWPHTAACIASVMAAEPELDLEIILADDASTDETRNARERVPGLIVCRQESNVGFLRNCNIAARMARGTYLLLLNNDTQVQSRALTQMLRVFSLRADAGLVGAKLVNPDGTLQEAGGIILRDASGWNYGRGLDPADRKFNYLKGVDYCSGACIMLRRDLWEQVGGFDERFSPAYYEDTDLAFKVRAVGRQVYYQPAAVVIHREGTSHGTDVRSGVKARQVENRSAFRAKWQPVLDREHSEAGRDEFHARDRSRSRPCILVVDHYVPEPDRDAGSRSMWAILQVLDGIGLNVKFWPHNLCPVPEYASRLEELGIEIVCGTAGSGAFAEWISANGHDIDYVMMSRPQVAADVIEHVRQHSDAKVIYYGHDIHHWRMRAQASVAGDRRLEAHAESMRALEESLWRRADVVYYLSAAETEEVRRTCPDTVARTIPGYFFESPREPLPELHPRQGILFVAGFAHPPNVDAALWLVREIMPIVRGRTPGVHLWLAGSNPTDQVQALASRDVTVTGNLSDDELAALYRQCRVAAVPLRFGAGVKHKVLEAMHHGTPLVTTSVGAQGLADLGEAIPVVDGAGPVAAAIVGLLSDDAAWRTASARGREYVMRRYSRQAMSAAIEQDISASALRRVPRAPMSVSAPLHGRQSSWSRRWRVPVAVLLMLCIAQALVLLRNIDRPGLYYDEILFVNAAVGGVGDEFVTQRVGRVPLMLMPYIGALKAWIWSPIFAVWEVGPASVRIPSIVIGLCGNMLACLAMGVWFGRTAAVLTAFAVCFDPTVGMQSRLDWGPNAIMFLCRGGFLLSVALACTGRTRSGLIGMFAFAAAGCFDKLSFLWIAMPGFVAFAVAERVLVRDLFRRHQGQMLAWGAGVAALMLAAVALAVRAPLESRDTTLAARAIEAGRLLWQAVAGDGAVTVIRWGSAGSHGGEASLVIGALGAAAALGLGATRHQHDRWRRSWRLLVMLFALSMALFAATRAATGPHHAALIAGLWQLPFIPPIAAGISRARSRNRWLGPYVQCGLVAVACITCLAMTWQRVDAVAAPPVNPNWDRANWLCGQYVATGLEEPVIFTDWGMGNHAIAVTRGRSGRMGDWWPSFRSVEGARSAIQVAAPSALYCLRMPRFETMRGNRGRFLDAAAAAGLQPRRVKVILSETGAEMIEIVRLVPAVP